MKALAFVASAFLSAVAFSQTRGSFLDVDGVSDITVNSLGDGLSYQVVLGANPTFTYNSVVYTITDLIGFYALSNDVDVNATASNQGVWTANIKNSGTGGIAGWKTNPNSGLTPGQSYTFVYDSLDTSTVDELGFDVRINGTFPGTTGNTGHIAVVPEPAAFAALSIGLIALRRKRKA
ncbi:MAG: PEP-CTERM sorting domain-containing protein [Armatimonadetes bacterium]|nr:PEP-CTERM sorting domain-containing protein [Armatimonadota bacterium]MBS1728132.1 PEP-CTERM sorting domain-containing protein [Armatimonadota bacterium]